MNYEFISDRLGFRRWQPADTAPFAALNADPTVMQYFPSTQTLAQTEDRIQRIHADFAKYGRGLYAVDVLATQEFIGFIGFLLAGEEYGLPFTPCDEIGWRLKQAAWGKGYATEGAKRCLAYGFEELELTEVYAWTAIPNQPSERIMQKIGMQKHGEFDHPKLEKGSWLEQHVVYRISTIEWDATK